MQFRQNMGVQVAGRPHGSRRVATTNAGRLTVRALAAVFGGPVSSVLRFAPRNLTRCRVRLTVTVRAIRSTSAHCSPSTSPGRSPVPSSVLTIGSSQWPCVCVRIRLASSGVSVWSLRPGTCLLPAVQGPAAKVKKLRECVDFPSPPRHFLKEAVIKHQRAQLLTAYFCSPRGSHTERERRTLPSVTQPLKKLQVLVWQQVTGL